MNTWLELIRKLARCVAYVTLCIAIPIATTIKKCCLAAISPAFLLAAYCVCGTCCSLGCGDVEKLLKETLLGILAGCFIVGILIADKKSVHQEEDVVDTYPHYRREILMAAIGGYLVGVTLHVIHHFHL